ncbi:septation regulator SpoVG [Aceticella autotrophica]|uniref:Septation regulator SpoVG n=1 Tax=Aceticella autotrophica TaxID=2755338 RepID=A0A975AW75_9THEO|nr:septation regulator SpoVG [Aceticella autotrophica]QSZ27607.1 septation regulator SpoVG [Aceticella autotrophica]
MEITDIKVSNVKKEGKVKAYLSVVFDNAFVVNGIRLMEGKNGLFAAMPHVKNKKGEFKDIAHPIHNSMRKKLTETIIEEYKKKAR